MNISINCPSYKRPKVETLDYLPFCKVWVCETEYDNYVDANKKYQSNIISCKQGIQGNLCRIRNHILNTEFNNGVDAVCLIDDDMKAMNYFDKDFKSDFEYENYLLHTDNFIDFIINYSYLCEQFNFKLWGVNALSDPMAYRPYIPFSTTSYIGGPFSVHLKNPLRYDERLPLKEDYDLTLQHMNKYRGCLRVNKYHYNVKQNTQSGGCASYRNSEKEKEQLLLLIKKWGNKIVKIDNSNKGKTKKIKMLADINPIIKVPIKGI